MTDPGRHPVDSRLRGNDGEIREDDGEGCQYDGEENCYY